MAAEAFDVWLVESNAVYKGVPYDVVSDWVQQGRITTSDMLRRVGTEDWLPIAETPLRPFLPGVQAETAVPPPADDTAEAITPIEFEFSYRRKRTDEDDDVDMIPLIDISLVLLVFFMMTASTATMSSPVPVPEVAFGSELSLSPEVRIDLVPVAEGVSFAVAYGSESVKTENAKLDQAALVAKLKAQLQNSPEALRIHVAAHKDAPYEAIRDLVNELADLKTFGRGISNVYAEVSEKRP